MARDALLLVDIQNDFLPGGRLAVPSGDQTVAPARKLMACFEIVLATQDWHPPNHLSFASNHEGQAVGDLIELDGLQQVLWPDHCIQDSVGAEIAKELELEKIAHVSRKGQNPKIDSYSGFFDNGHRQATDLHEQLQARGVERLFIGGLATEYCVKFTLLDAISLGYETFIVSDLCRGLSELDSHSALEEMVSAGAKLVGSQDLCQER